jgi:tetratricopeptide (TPR) repeat protein
MTEDRLEQAETLLETREQSLPDHLLQARRLFEQCLDQDPAAAQTGLSETCFWLGEYASDATQAEAYYAAGVEAGKQAVHLADEWVDSHLWYCANMGSHGVLKGIMSSLFYLKPIEQHGKKALDIDKSYFYGAPLRLMGRFYHQCPGWPIGSGDLKKSVAHLEEAVTLGEPFILNHLYLGEALLARKEKKPARSTLEAALKISGPPELQVYHARVRRDIEALLSSST